MSALYHMNAAADAGRIGFDNVHTPAGRPEDRGMRMRDADGRIFIGLAALAALLASGPATGVGHSLDRLRPPAALADSSRSVSFPVTYLCSTLAISVW